MPDRASTFLGIPTGFLWPSASICLGIFAASWMFGWEPNEAGIDRIHFWHVAAGVCGLMAAGVAFWTEEFRRWAWIALFVNSPALLVFLFILFAIFKL